MSNDCLRNTEAVAEECVNPLSAWDFDEPVETHVRDAISVTVAALAATTSKRQALSLWTALRSLIEAKFLPPVVVADHSDE